MEQHPSLSTLSSIKALEENYKQLSSTHLRDLLADPGRNSKMKIESNDFIFDFSHEKFNEQTLNLLSDLAKEAKIKEQFS